MRAHPSQYSIFKFLMCCGPGARVPCARHQPELHVIRGSRRKDDRMARADVVVVFSMDQQDGNSRGLNRVQWAGLKQVDTIAHARINTGRGNHGPAQCPAEPGLEMQGPGDTLVTHLACRREWAFYDDRAVARLRGQRLQHQGSPVRLTEAIDAPWRIML